MKFAYNNLNINASPGCGECRGEHFYKDSSKKMSVASIPSKTYYRYLQNLILVLYKSETIKTVKFFH